MLQVSDLDAGYGPVTIVSSLTLTLRDREIIGVVAPNGTGKSTLFKAICGLCDVYKGTLEWSVDGEAATVDLRTLSVAQRVRAGVRYVPERSEIFAESSVYDNLQIASEAIARPWSVQDFEEGLGRLFPLLVERRSASADSLSGGQRRMLSVAMALVQEPKLLLVDEPFAGLAPAVVTSLIEVFRGIRNMGVSLAVIDHNLPAILSLSDRIVLLRLGRMHFDRPRTEVSESDILEAFA